MVAMTEPSWGGAVYIPSQTSYPRRPTPMGAWLKTC